jgi:hypothetical protein
MKHQHSLTLCSLIFLSSVARADVGYADVVVEFHDGGNGTLSCAEGQGGSFPPPASSPTCVPFSVVLGSDPDVPTLSNPADYLSIPMGSFVTVGFTDEIVTDGPGDDLFIQEVGNASELADVYVSSLLSTNPADYVFLGQANGNSISSFDLGSIGFLGPVSAVKIVSLQNGGAPSAPGFDLASVRALQFAGSHCSSLANSTGGSALISTSGSPSLGANDLVLQAGPVPNQTGLFFFGPSAQQVPFGNGLLCITGGLSRLPASSAQNGILEHGVNYSLAPATLLQPGTTWSFQAWYRDTAAGGSLFNTSDAVRVTFGA